MKFRAFEIKRFFVVNRFISNSFLFFLLTFFVFSAPLIFGFSSTPAFLRLDRAPQAEEEEEPLAVFPHLFHQRMFMCYNCHTEIFSYGKDTYTHDDFDEGKYCGRCHNGKIAQNIDDMDCETCHR